MTLATGTAAAFVSEGEYSTASNRLKSSRLRVGIGGILDRQDAGSRVLRSAGSGSTISTIAPPSAAFEALTRPPWRATIACTIDRPRPLPDASPVGRAASAL